MVSKLILEDGSIFEGQSFGAPTSAAGEVVFSTGMVGYPESLTDPSYLGQILILTYPLIGNYGVPEKKHWESHSIKLSGLIVSNYIDTPSHFQSKMTLDDWLKREKVPALEILDTRLLTQKIRTKGTMLGKIVFKNKDIEFYDPNKENLVAKISTAKVYDRTSGVGYVQSSGKREKTVFLIDCGAKKNIERCLIKRGVRVITVPWDFDPFDKNVHLRGVPQAQTPRLSSRRTRSTFDGTPFHLGGVMASTSFQPATSEVLRSDSSEVNPFDAIIVSNGPGDPKMADKTIATIKKALDKKIPILGVCLGHQLLALAAGGDTTKLKFGHRSQNQPCLLEGSKRCFITTQNHGFAVSKIPDGFRPWFTNANDNSNEGLIHKKLPIMSVQFHPEANPGPNDTEWIFDFFLERV